MKAEYPPTPELDKMKAISEYSQQVGEFLEWLQNEKEIVFAEWMGDTLVMANFPMQRLLAEFFDIDLDKVEDERLAVLDFVRNQP